MRLLISHQCHLIFHRVNKSTRDKLPYFKAVNIFFFLNVDCQLHSGSSPAETAECWLADWVTGCVADWLVSWIHVKYDLHWEHVVANPSPRYAYSPIVCDSWLYLHRGEERQVGIRLCISVAELRVRSTSGWLWGVCVCGASLLCFKFHNSRTHIHAHTLTLTHHRELTCCWAAAACVHRAAATAHKHKARHTGALLHKQTNTPAAPGKSLWQSAEGGKANKTNSLIYMTVACFTLACWGNDRVKLCWKQQVMKSDGPICGIL